MDNKDETSNQYEDIAARFGGNPITWRIQSA